MKRADALDVNRTLLFLLVVGLILVAWHRNRHEPSSAPMPKAAPAAEPRPAAITPTNSIADRSLASAGQAVQK